MQQQWMVWCLRLHADTEGPSLISCAAWLHRDSRLQDAPSWHTVIGIATVSNGRFPLPVFFDSSTSASLDAVIPVPAILSGFSTQVAFIQILVELIQYAVRQQRRDHTALWHTFTDRPEETNINTAFSTAVS